MEIITFIIHLLHSIYCVIGVSLRTGLHNLGECITAFHTTPWAIQGSEIYAKQF